MSLQKDPDYTTYNHISFLINIYSKLKLVPYYFSWDKKADCLNIKTNVFQKFCCILLHAFASFPCLHSWNAIIEKLSTNQADLLVLYRFLEDTVFVSMLYYQVYFLWRRQSCFLEMVNGIHPFLQAAEEPRIKKSRTNLKNNRMNKYVLIVLAFFSLNFLFKVAEECIYRGGRRQGEAVANFVFSMFGWMENLPLSLLWIHQTIKYFSATFLTIVASFQMFLHGVIISVLLGIQTVWKTYKNQILPHETTMEMGIALYLEFKRSVQQFNELFTVPMLLIYLNNLTSFAALPEYLSCDTCSYLDQLCSRMYMIFYTLVTILIWTLSAQFHSDIQQTMRSWVYGFHHAQESVMLSNNYNIDGKQQQVGLTFEQRMKLISFMGEVETDGLGVSCKFFTITYSAFGSTVGLIVTYAIIFNQLTAKSKV